MSSYYHKLLEQREKFRGLQSRKKRLYGFLSVILIICLGVGAYFFVIKRNSLEVKLGKPTVQIQISPALNDEIKPKVEQFAKDNTDLKVECDSVCEKPDILFDVQKQSSYAHADLIGKFSSAGGKYKFRAPDTLKISGVQEIWMMSQTGGKLADDLRNYLKEFFPSDKVTVNFVGDIMLSRTVDKKIVEAANYLLPFTPLGSFIKTADISLGNLESPFYDQGAPVRSGMIFKADPRSVAGLKYAGFDIVTLANNHFGNQGVEGMLYTFSLLKKNGIEFIGAGYNLGAAQRILVKEVNGLKIAFIGVENYSITPESYFATKNSPGLLHVEADAIGQLVKKAKTKADVVIVTYHGGTEYAPAANDQQREFAHAAINAGADIVIGHHPHVIQGVENYKGKMILYSLGNFVFDQMWSTETQQGMVAQLTFEGNLLTAIKLVPVHIYNFCQPQKASILERDQVIQKMLKNSDL